MIVVEVVKLDPYMGKTVSKTWECFTEEKARARLAAQLMVNRCTPDRIQEKKDEAGNLTRIVIDLTPAKPIESPANDSAALSEDDCKVSTEEIKSEFDQLKAAATAPSASIASENEACALLVEAMLGKKNNLAILIRARMAKKEG